MTDAELGTTAVEKEEEKAGPESTAVYRPTDSMDVEKLMAMVVGADGPERVETLAALIGLRNDEQDRQASGDFTRAFAEFHRTCPPIPRDTKGKVLAAYDGAGTITLMFSGLETIQRVAGPHLKRLGFAYSFTVPVATERSLKVQCVLYHESGHSRTSEMIVPISKIPKATTGQEYSGAYTTGKRITLSGVLGITTEDVDANESAESGLVVSEEQLRTLQALVGTKDVDIDKVLQNAEAASLSDVLASKFEVLKRFLETRKDK